MRGISIGQIVLLLILGAVLILTSVWGFSVWSASSGVEMGKHGWIALGLGTFFSLLIGCGLMALMFSAAAAVTTMQPILSGTGSPVMGSSTLPESCEPRTRAYPAALVPSELCQGDAYALTEVESAEEEPRPAEPDEA